MNCGLSPGDFDRGAWRAAAVRIQRPLFARWNIAPWLFAYPIDLVFLDFVHFFDSRVGAGFARGLGGRGRRACVWQRRLPGRRRRRPRRSRRRRGCGLSCRCLCVKPERARYQQCRERG